MAKIQVTAQLEDVFGTALAAGSFGGLNVQLCGYGSAIPRVAGTALLAQTTPLESPVSAGAVSFAVYGNDAITPAGTYYTVQAVDTNGNVIQTSAYQFLSAGTSTTGPQIVQTIGNILPGNANADSVAVTFPKPTTAGNAIVTLIFNYNRFGNYTTTDTQNNPHKQVYFAQTSQGGGGKVSVQMDTAIPGGAETITCAGNAFVQAMLAIEIAGLAANPFDAANCLIYPDTVSAVPPFAVPLIATQASDLLLAVSFGNPTLTTHGLGPGQSQPYYSLVSSDNSAAMALYTGQTTSAGSYNASFNSSYGGSGQLTGLLLALTAGTATGTQAAAQSVDLSTLTPYVPDYVAPVAVTLTPITTGTGTGGGGSSAAVGVVTVAPSATPVFNGQLGNVFQIALAQFVSSSSATNLTPGELYVISVQQPTSGATYGFTWPGSLATSAPPVAIANGKQTTLLAAYMGGNNFLQIGPILYQ